MSFPSARPFLNLMSVSLQGLTRRLPGFAAVAAALVGAINIATALTPNIRWRGHLLLQFEPVETMRVFHALSFPAGVALLLVAPYLAKRRRRAFESAVALMLALGVFDLLKGLDFEETIVTWTVAIVLIMGRDSFRVRHDAITLRSAIWRVPALGAAGIIAAAVATWATQGHPSLRTITPGNGPPGAAGNRGRSAISTITWRGCRWQFTCSSCRC